MRALPSMPAPGASRTNGDDRDALTPSLRAWRLTLAFVVVRKDPVAWLRLGPSAFVVVGVQPILAGGEVSAPSAAATSCGDRGVPSVRVLTMVATVRQPRCSHADRTVGPRCLQWVK